MAKFTRLTNSIGLKQIDDYFGNCPNKVLLFDLLNNSYHQKGLSGLIDLILAINVQGTTVGGKSILQDGKLKKIAIVKDLMDVLQMFNLPINMTHAKWIVWGYVKQWEEKQRMNKELTNA